MALKFGIIGAGRLVGRCRGCRIDPLPGASIPGILVCLISGSADSRSFRILRGSLTQDGRLLRITLGRRAYHAVGEGHGSHGKAEIRATLSVGRLLLFGRGASGYEPGCQDKDYESFEHLGLFTISGRREPATELDQNGFATTV